MSEIQSCIRRLIYDESRNNECKLKILERMSEMVWSQHSTDIFLCLLERELNDIRADEWYVNKDLKKRVDPDTFHEIWVLLAGNRVADTSVRLEVVQHILFVVANLVTLVFVLVAGIHFSYTYFNW